MKSRGLSVQRERRIKIDEEKTKEENLKHSDDSTTKKSKEKEKKREEENLKYSDDSSKKSKEKEKKREEENLKYSDDSTKKSKEKEKKDKEEEKRGKEGKKRKEEEKTLRNKMKGVKNLGSPTEVPDSISGSKSQESSPRHVTRHLSKRPKTVREHRKSVDPKRSKSPRDLYKRERKFYEDPEFKFRSRRSKLSPNMTVTLERARWSQISSEMALDLGLEPFEFLCELQNLLLENKNMQQKFLAANGFNKLVSHLLTVDFPISKKILEILSENLEEKEIFISLFLESAETVTKITHLLLKYPYEPSIKTQVYQLLANLAETPQTMEIADFDVHATILCAFNYYKSKSTEQDRFEHLVRGLSLDQSDEYLLAIFKLINTIIDCYDHLETRINIRREFTKIGLDSFVSLFLTESENRDSVLMYHVQAFALSRDTDLRANQGLGELVEYSHEMELTNHLMKHTECNTQVQKLVVAILQNLSRMHVDKTQGVPKWIFLEKIVSQLNSVKSDFMSLNGILGIDLDLERLFLLTQMKKN